jgi:hypothetical protein
MLTFGSMFPKDNIAGNKAYRSGGRLFRNTM